MAGQRALIRRCDFSATLGNALPSIAEHRVRDTEVTVALATSWGGPFVRSRPPVGFRPSGVMLYWRRLPHVYATHQPVFLTWRLHGSLPPHRPFPTTALRSGEAFVALDRLLDEARTGPFYLRQPAVADLVVEAIPYNSHTLGRYDWHAFVVMPNHVHLLVTPAVALPKLTKSLKGITAKRANALLALTGRPFWQEESYDHVVRQEREFNKYIEENPVRAGLVKEASQYRWSSAGWATGGSPADQGADQKGPPRGVRPTIGQHL